MSVLRDDEEREVVNFKLAHKKNGILTMSPASKEKNTLNLPCFLIS